MTNYEKETRDAYRTSDRAAAYKRFQTTDWTWGRFVTWLEQKAIARELRRHRWSASDQLLDIPCGTGILGKTLREFPFKIIASDISPEMMALAREEYPSGRLVEIRTADITATPFPRASFACVVTLGFLHRVPPEIKRAALKEISALSNRLVIVSCSVDTPSQRLKHAVLLRLKPNHVPAPCPAKLEEVVAECEAQGLRLVRASTIVPFLSAHALLVLEKP